MLLESETGNILRITWIDHRVHGNSMYNASNPVRNWAALIGFGFASSSEDQCGEH